ncbi:MAG: dTDP-glucose 4,6-dehydratase [Candidatus Heimdallarchaeota archaeon LC_3]|nr:MAG: dTDP-glucose 4,6-dehydratase [Candidatus Heimdallarchaeota archaeon LC_3]
MTSSNNSKKILITGSTGLLGSHILRLLLEQRQYTPVAMVRTLSQKQACENIGIDAVIGDLQNSASLKVLSETDFYAVINSAAIAGDWIDKQLAQEVNVKGTKELIKNLPHVKIFVHISTIGVYGHKAYHNITEDRKYRKSSTYEDSKIDAEKYIRRIVDKQKQTKFIIIRPPTLYGENDRHFFPRLLKYIRLGKFKFVGKGIIFFPLIHAEDAARAILLSLESNCNSGSAFHISGPDTTIRDFIHILSKKMNQKTINKTYPYYPFLFLSFFYELFGKLSGKEPYIFRKRVRYFGRSRHVNISKAKNELKFEPKISLEEGIERTLKFFIEEESIKNIKLNIKRIGPYVMDIPYYFVFILEKISNRISNEKSLIKNDIVFDKST